MRTTCLLFCALSLAGCASDGPAGRALAAAGIARAPEMPDAAKPPRKVALRLHAAPRLNVDAKGRPLALVARGPSCASKPPLPPLPTTPS
ncbi:hypothetical protein [Massilia sp. Se16.2.3]|uniref:hypothetical protein n=1 Tax=Massilia sp. Se16.2.3 TaxID=2709303 RepID=UPI001E3FC64D|nr:hypothetical protein [Massilia sp. Se16.2.3]